METPHTLRRIPSLATLAAMILFMAAHQSHAQEGNCPRRGGGAAAGGVRQFAGNTVDVASLIAQAAQFQALQAEAALQAQQQAAALQAARAQYERQRRARQQEQQPRIRRADTLAATIDPENDKWSHLRERAAERTRHLQERIAAREAALAARRRSTP